MLFTLLALQLAVAPNACVNFSGRYVIQGEDGRVAVHIEQTRCARIAVSWESSMYPNARPLVHSLALGGAFQRDAGWFGARESQRTAATLRARTLELFRLPVTARQNASRELMLRLELLADGDLCVSSARTSSISPAKRAGRQRDEGEGAADAVARRSEEGCGTR